MNRVVSPQPGVFGPWYGWVGPAQCERHAWRIGGCLAEPVAEAQRICCRVMESSSE